MKHCKNCNKCRYDLVSQYVLGIDSYVCDQDHHRIQSPFWEGRTCENYKKENFNHIGFFEYLLQQNCSC